jgi:hypothetical protein
MISPPSQRIALVKWDDVPGDIEQAIHHELTELGHRTTFFKFDEPVPRGMDVVFSFAPYRELLQIPRQLQALPARERPLFVHWNTEGLLNVNIPYPVSRAIGALRSGWERLNDANGRWSYSRMRGALRFGDYHYAQARGWLDVFADVSAVYARRFSEHGLPAIHAPFGASPLWYADLALERDIDVLWMGMRGTRRRARILDDLERQLGARGVRFHIADGIKNPFVFGEARTALLNRAKITVNVLRTWWSENSLRFAFAAPNRSLIVSEEVLPHSPAFRPGVHYVCAPVERLADTILRYLERPEEMRRIVESAHDLVTKDLTLGKSIDTIMAAATNARESTG